MSQHEGEERGARGAAPDVSATEAPQYPPPQYPPPQYPPPQYPPPQSPHQPPQDAQPQVQQTQMGSRYESRSRLDDSLVARAKANDDQALATMFSQFLPEGEQIIDCQYLGVLGLWGIGTHSFAAVTSRRVATLQISLLGGVHYQEGALEYVNSAAAHQPSMVSLYLGFARFGFIALLVAISAGVAIHWAVGFLVFVLAVVGLPLYVRFYHRKHKSGLVFWIREGVQVYAFIDRKRMLVANRLYRECMNLREDRLRALGHP
jgi:hypothetical protein